MNMGMGPHLSAPGVQNTVKSNGCSQAFGVLTELQKGLGGVLKQQIIHYPSVVLAQGGELMRQRKNTMVIRYWQQIF